MPFNPFKLPNFPFLIFFIPLIIQYFFFFLSLNYTTIHPYSNFAPFSALIYTTSIIKPQPEKGQHT